MSVVTVVLEEGRRQRKKRQTRQAISDAATRLFFEHGFDAVSLAQVAEAADVSVKTIFNHFGSKEDLFFDRAGELRESLVRTITQRSPGQSILDALAALLIENWLPFQREGWDECSSERFENYRCFLSVQEQSPALQARRLVIERDLAAAVLAVVADELARSPEDPAIKVWSAMMAATLELRSREFAAAALAGLDADEIRRRVTAVVGEGFRRMALAFPDVCGALR